MVTVVTLVVLVASIWLFIKLVVASEINQNRNEQVTIRELTEKERLQLFLYERVQYDYARYKKIKKVIEKESEWNPSVQSYCIGLDGKREESYGLVQINIIANPDVTKEQALDPIFAINYIVDAEREGKLNKWSAYKSLRAKGLI